MGTFTPSKDIILQNKPQQPGKVITEQELAKEQGNGYEMINPSALGNKVLGSNQVAPGTVSSEQTNKGQVNDNVTNAPWGNQDFYQWFYDDWKKRKQEDEARYAEQEGRLKSNKLMTTIGDGLSAMHEAYAKARGVEPMTSGVSLSGKWRDRWDKLQEDRANNRAAHMNALAKLHNMRETDRYNRERAVRYDRQQDRLEAQANLAVRKQDWLEKYQQGTLDLRHEENEINRQYKEGLITQRERDLSIKELNAQANWLRAQKYNTGGSGSGGGKYDPAKDPNMRRVKYINKNGEEVVEYQPIQSAPAQPTTPPAKAPAKHGKGGNKRGGNKGGGNKKGGKYGNVAQMGL